jgi:uncharacterized membrane protein
VRGTGGAQRRPHRAVAAPAGPTFYGFGFALAVFVVVLAGFVLLTRKLELLEYETFMLQ